MTLVAYHDLLPDDGVHERKLSVHGEREVHRVGLPVQSQKEWLRTMAFWQSFNAPVTDEIKLFGGNLDFPKIKKFKKFVLIL